MSSRDELESTCLSLYKALSIFTRPVSRSDMSCSTFTCLILAVGYGGQALALVLEQLGDVAQAIQFCQVYSYVVLHSKATCYSSSDATCYSSIPIFCCIPATALYCHSIRSIRSIRSILPHARCELQDPSLPQLAATLNHTPQLATTCRNA